MLVIPSEELDRGPVFGYGQGEAKPEMGVCSKPCGHRVGEVEGQLGIGRGAVQIGDEDSNPTPLVVDDDVEFAGAVSLVSSHARETLSTKRGDLAGENRLHAMFPCGGPVEGVATRKARLGPYTTSEGLAVAVFEELRDVGPDYLAHVEGGELLVVPVPS